MLRDLDSLIDIVDAAQRILQYTRAMTKAEFAADFKTQDAVNRCLEIIGEATKRCRTNIENNTRKSRGRQWRGCATFSFMLMTK